MKVYWIFVSDAKSEKKVIRQLKKFEDTTKVSLSNIEINPYHKQDLVHRFKAYASSFIDEPDFCRNVFLILSAVNKAAYPWAINGPRDGYIDGVVDSDRALVVIPGLKWISFEISPEDYVK